MRWWQGAERGIILRGGYGGDDGITTTPGFQDTLDDIYFHHCGEESDTENNFELGVEFVSRIFD